ncbi:hypothetical protein F4818DRAFT_154522 [Hypoxylon cercidicola]|nr:hypothetical protein F4818DRAFT_154522 [Hypoxylon cercidicola]
MASINSTCDFMCANWSQDNPNCARTGTDACKGCLLVLYCGSSCQKAHWKTHKSDCRLNPLLKEDWRPRWEVENRVPAFIGGHRFQTFNYQRKFLWGNVPAFDLVNLASNEGLHYTKGLDLLFAASGDIRNVIETVVAIPDAFRNPIKIYMNDRDTDVVGRNAIMLLLALTEDDAAVATENIIHLWYSAFIPQSLQDVLKGKVHELVQSICTKIEGKPPDAILAKTWTFGSRSLRLVLTKQQWFNILSSLEPPLDLTVERARDIRRSVTLADQRLDFRERTYFGQYPGVRASSQKFREDGVLLPFGTPRDSFTIPNPTLFRNTSSWPLKDGADPLHGWQLSKILSVSSGRATNDIYGKLAVLLKDRLTRFHGRLKTSDISFHLLNVNAEDLQGYVKPATFDRIEVSNISDTGYLGMPGTIGYIGHLLKQPDENPNATLVALFLNAVDEIFDDNEKLKVLESEMKQVWSYMQPQPPRGLYDANMLIGDIALEQVRDADKYFDRYMDLQNFAMLAELSGMEFKKKHTIIEPWPLRLKKKPYQKGAEEEFLTLLSSSMSGCERYMEWRYKR